MTKLRTYIQVVCALCIILLIPVWGWCVPPGTVISNTAQVTYDADSASRIVMPSNTVTSVTEIIPTQSILEILQYLPASPGAELVMVPATEYSTSGTDTGSFAQISPPIPSGSSEPINLNNPLPLVPAGILHQGEPVFLRLTDPDKNLYPLVAETVLVTVSVGLLGEKEVLRLQETGLNTGVFAGYIQSSGNPPSATANDGILSVVEECEVISDYVDVADANDKSSAAVRVDPFGMVFSSATGLPLDGAGITLIAIDTGLPAAVLGDDGVSSFPATIISGGTVTDSGGKTYNFPQGGYRFPLVSPGNYRLDVIAPAGFGAPSTAATPVLQALPGGPFAIVEPGSRGEPFVLNPGPPLHLDIPVDVVGSPLWLRKIASRDIVAKGDFLQYNVYIENSTGGQATDVVVTDRLPLGFRYQQGSAKIDDTSATDPVISSDGRSLAFHIGALAADTHVNITYVVEVAAGARPGEAINRASAATGAGVTSNTANAAVEVQEDLLRSRSFIAGRVIADNCEDMPAENDDGVEGVRIYLEDGTYVITDRQGMFHLEGVQPGVHVVQLDLDSLPEKYEVVSCEKNSRFGGRSYSQFVDLQGGTLWRADFHVALKPEAKGEASLQLESALQENMLVYEILFQGSGVPLSNPRLVIMMPEGTSYKEGSSRLDDLPVPDPSLADNVLTFRLEDTPNKWARIIHFTGNIGSGSGEADLRTRALLIFDTPAGSNQKTPPVEVVVKTTGDNEEILQQSSANVETTGLRPGEKQEAPASKAETQETMAGYDEAWLEAAKLGLEWLWPEADYYPAIPSVNLSIKHHANEKLTLLQDGREVSSLNFDGMIKNKAGTNAVSRWTGVDLQAGNNHFELISYDTTGKETGRLERTVHYSGAPVQAELLKEQSILVADGRTAPVIAVRLLDKDGYPVRQGTSGAVTVEPPHRIREESETLQKYPLSGLDGQKPGYVAGKDGIAFITLQPTTRSGEAVVNFHFTDSEQEVRVWLQPEERDWILVGIAEGTIGYNIISGNMENAGAAGVDDSLFEEGRLAFFAKGRIKGKWLLTIAYDSAKKTTGAVENSLMQTVDPDTYYTLYGDAAQQDYDAASARKLFLKIEREQFYALFGDYDTGLTVTELARYSRTFNGVKSELQTETYGFKLFAAESSQGFVKDEIRGNGTSGMYHLSRKNIVINTEKVIIETRDRFRSEVIISSRSKSRHIDYNIDYDSGTLFFREPIFSKDENFNPVFIVVDYETESAVDKKYNYGGRGSIKLMGETLEVGTTYIHEEQSGEKGDLGGVDATLDIGKNTRIRAEFAASKTEFQEEDTEGNAYLVEVTHRSTKLDGTIYLRELGEGFGLGQQNGSEAGTRKLGADGAYLFNQKIRVIGQIYRQFNHTTDAERDLAEAAAYYTSGNSSLHAGLRHAEDRFADGLVNRSDQMTMGASHSMFDDRFQLRLERDQSLGDNNDNSDFPTRTMLGADYKLTKSWTLFGEQEFVEGDNEDTQGTRLGMKATPWSGGQATSSVEREVTEYGPRVFANLGLRQILSLNERWSVDGGLDHSRTVKNPGNVPFNINVPSASGAEHDFTAVSMGTTYREGNWSWNSRIEFRLADNDDKWGLTTGVYVEPQKGLGLSAQAQIFVTDTEAGADATNGNIRFGLAYRPANSRWIVLDRLDFIFDEQVGGNFDFSNRRIVNIMNANYKPNRKTQVALQYGIRYVRDTIDGEDYRGFTDLIGLEARYDLNKQWDIGIRGSVLHSWSAGQFDYSSGLSLGRNIFDNAWICAGYNFLGFKDQDFSRGSFTAQGPFLQFRLKLDQQSVRNALETWGKT